jgi:hypothetical protein
LVEAWEALHQHLPLYGQVVLTPLPNMEGLLLKQASLIWPELRQHSSGIYMFVSPNTGTYIPQIHAVTN